MVRNLIPAFHLRSHLLIHAGVKSITYEICKKRFTYSGGERGGSVVECQTPEREVRGSRPTAAVLCP